MPRKHEHQIIGSLAGALIAITQYDRDRDAGLFVGAKRGSFGEFIEVATVAAIGGLTGAFTGILPDIIEPATTPNHRSAAHGILATTIVGFSVSQVVNNSTDPLARIILSAALWGYVSHVAADATTPAGIPFAI